MYIKSFFTRTCMYSSFKGDEFFQKYIMKVDSTLKLWTSSSAGKTLAPRISRG